MDLFRQGSPVHTLWWHCSDKGLWWLWRPWCWVRRYHVPHHCDAHFELCTMCGATLWLRSDGIPNPYIGHGVRGENGWMVKLELVDRTPVGRRTRTR